MSRHPGGNPPPGQGDACIAWLPEGGPEVLAAGKILVELGVLDHEQAEEELAALNDWIEEHCGRAAFAWAAYWEYRAALEAITGQGNKYITNRG
jgi:hypothetical protein